MNDLLLQIANQGLKIGNNWQLIQVGDNLWVQNLFNETVAPPAADNQTNQTNENVQPSGNQAVTNETEPAGGNDSIPDMNQQNQTAPPANVQASAKFLVGGNDNAAEVVPVPIAAQNATEP